MNIHEHQAKEILRSYGVLVPYGDAAYTVDEAASVGSLLKAEHGSGIKLVIKAQIHAGGRGKAGGVKVVDSVEQVKAEAQRMLGMILITPQTGPDGKVVKRLYVEVGSKFKKEYYLSLVLDRGRKCLTFIASAEGGMEIEEIAHTNPEKIIKTKIEQAVGVMDHNVRDIVFGLKLDSTYIKEFGNLMRALYDAATNTDALQIEINPLVQLETGEFMALDAKFNFDDNALYRRSEIALLRDEDEEEPLELEAKELGLSYIKMDGNIGCMVNGAGLAMATMDIIKMEGGDPANFLDVGGGATEERVSEALRIIMSDKNVQGILINIFGGIMRCDIIANGVVKAAKSLNINIPIVLRLEGTNAEAGKSILKNSGLKLIPADDLGEAAKKIVQEVKSKIVK